jgi:hypothetical protein
MERYREQVAFMALGASCVLGAYLIAQLQRRVQHLESMVSVLHNYIEADFQGEIDEKFVEIIDRLDEE